MKSCAACEESSKVRLWLRSRKWPLTVKSALSGVTSRRDFLQKQAAVAFTANGSPRPPPPECDKIFDNGESRDWWCTNFGDRWQATADREIRCKRHWWRKSCE